MRLAHKEQERKEEQLQPGDEINNQLEITMAKVALSLRQQSKLDWSVKKNKEDYEEDVDADEVLGISDEMDEDIPELTDTKVPVVINELNEYAAEFENEDEEEDDDSSAVLNCPECPSMFGAQTDLRRHFRARHFRSCFWTCGTCGLIFPNLEEFKVHLMKVHKMNRDTFCSDDPSDNVLLRPVLTVPKDVQDCPECDGKFANKTSLNLHRLRRHISKRLTQNVACPVCNEEADDLTAHVRSMHSIEGVVCPHCGKILSKTCTLNRHIEQVHLNLQIHKPATCKECGKVFSKKGHLDRHFRTIHLGMKESSEPCPFCGKVFSTKSSLEPHIDMVHKGLRRKCPKCGKVLSDLWKHMRTVHGLYRRKTKIPKEALDLAAATEELQNAAEKLSNGDAQTSPSSKTKVNARRQSAS